MINQYFLAGKSMTQVVEESAPSVGSEVCIDGQYYRVVRSIRHISMIPPWRTNVHLEVSAEVEGGVIASGTSMSARAAGAPAAAMTPPAHKLG